MKKHRFLKAALLTLPMLFFSILSFAQSLTVKGTVKDESGAPMPGVTVIVKGSTQGTITNVEGLYSITMQDPNSTLTFSFIGMETQDINVAGSSNINVTLKTKASDLSEVVVVGYGTMKKSDITGAVASVSADELKTLSTTDAAAAIQGKAAGVQVLNYSGAPGQGASIRVRGYSSNSDKIGPLLIVDGLQVDNIQYLDPSMIESMEILKDAASAAIYGAQAGNGVVLITTKGGSPRDGQSSISYDMNVTSQRLARTPDLFGAFDYLKYKEMEGLSITSVPGATFDASGKLSSYNGTDTDWLDAVFEPTIAQQHAITFQGGNKNGRFLLSLNYLNNDGIVKSDKDVYKRLSGQINADYNVKKWLQIGTNNSLEKWSTKSVSHMDQYGTFMHGVMTLDPLTPVYFKDESEFTPAMKAEYANTPGRFLIDPSNGYYYATSQYQESADGNPLLKRDLADKTNGGVSLRGTIYGNLKPVKGLIITSRLGYRVSQSSEHNYSTPYYLNSKAKAEDYSISANANTGLFYQWDNFANYSLIMGKNDITAMAGMSYIENNWDNVSASASGPDILKGYESNFLYLDYVNSADKTSKSFGNVPGKSSQISYFGRLNYSYDNRYSVQFNYRADAFDSSKLSKSARWGYFPSFSAGWTLSNEEFLKDALSIANISFLKLRGSWGRNGNVNVLSGYKYTAAINYNGSWYQPGVTDGAQSFGSSPNGLAKPNLTWETSEQVDLGLDLRMFSSKLSFGVDYYSKETKDLLFTITPAPETGQGSATDNGGNILNQGLEFEASWKDKIGDFSYSISGNFATLHNEVTASNPTVAREQSAAAEGGNNKIHTAFEKGHKVWYFRGYDYLGVNREDGTPIYRDVDNNGKINEDDQVDLGSAIPTYTYGVTINLAYKGFDFNIFGTGVGGNKIFTLFKDQSTNWQNSLKYYYDNAWSADNKDASMPDPKTIVNSEQFWASSAAMFNGAFFKIKQIQLGYTVPSKYSQKLLISNLRAYVSMDDYFTLFTSYPGCDPETATTSNVQRAGFDNGTYPQAKKLIFGLNITF